MFKQFLRFCSFMQYGTLICATIAVIALQFVPSKYAEYEFTLIILALSLYALGFLAMATISVLNCVDVYAANRKAKGAVYAELIANETTEVVSPKKEMFWAVVQAIVCFCIMLFAASVLVGYIVKTIGA